LRQLALVERKSAQGPRIGALATQSDLAESEIFSTDYQAVRQAAAPCGSCQSRNVGTLGGNLCNGSPQADLVPALLVHDTVVTLESRGERRHRQAHPQDSDYARRCAGRFAERMTAAFA
jgi:CO/xanthine dehydrogenase FAD-binding subunit